MEYVMRISVSKGQARLTIPKELAVEMGILSEDGKQGRFTHVVIRGDRGQSILAYPVNVERIA